MSRRTRFLIAAVVALAVGLLLLLPPRPRPSAAAADGSLAPRASVRGAFHIHTNRSDGTGSVDEVAAAAARAGLQFIILTDHGDGMRAPLAPAVRSGVLVLDGVEISTTGGHYVAIGLTAPTPYRLSGEPRDVVEDVRRLGGFGIAAHPDSPKPALRWTEWGSGAPQDDGGATDGAGSGAQIDGLEWLNADTEWRDESRGALVRALVTYPWRPPETLGALLSHARTLLGRWDDLARTRRIVGLAGVDAHARIGLRDGPDPYGGRVLLKVPSYEASFRTFALHVELEAPLSADPAQAASALLESIRGGRVYTTLDALATPPTPAMVGFEASSGGHRARMGGFLAPAGAVEWRASVGAPVGATQRLICDGKLTAEAPAASRLEHRHDVGRLPSACRLEVGWDGGAGRVTWVVTNPIYLRASDASEAATAATPTPALRAGATAAERLPGDFGAQDAWAIERDPQSTASWRVLAAAASAPPASATTASSASAQASSPAPALAFTWQLRPGERVSQYVAFVTSRVDAIREASRICFRATAEKPMRVGVQVRRPLDRPGDGERWERSVYLDTTPREVVVDLDDMRPIAPTRTAHPPRDLIHALMFVIDTQHTPPGTAGTVRVENLRLER